MKGRPILGVTTGFLFGLFLGITLFLYGVIPLSSDLLWILPLLGILLGLIMAAWAPFGKSVEPVPSPTPSAPPPPEPVTDESDESAPDSADDEAIESAPTSDPSPEEESAAEPTEE